MLTQEQLVNNDYVEDFLTLCNLDYDNYKGICYTSSDSVSDDDPARILYRRFIKILNGEQSYSAASSAMCSKSIVYSCELYDYLNSVGIKRTESLVYDFHEEMLCGLKKLETGYVLDGCLVDMDPRINSNFERLLEDFINKRK